MSARTTILVVDDECDIRDMLEEYLSKQGFEVYTADSGVAMRQMGKTHDGCDLTPPSHGLPPEPQVRGVVFLAFTEALHNSISETIIPPHLRERHRQGMQRYLTTGQATLLGQRVETEAMRADGSLFPVEWTIAAVHLASQRVFTAYVRDITERQHMERALRDSEQRFRSLAEVRPVPVCIVDVEKEIFLYVSPGLAQLVGCSVEALLVRHPGTLFADPTEREAMRLHLRTTGAIDGYEFTLCRADGCTMPAGIMTRRIVYEGVRATVGAIVDLTERKRIEAELAQQREALYQSEKLSALGSLLAGVATTSTTRSRWW